MERNYEEIFNRMVDSTAKYLQINGLKAQVLGCSGGIDSTVSAAICHEVSKVTGIPLIGISLPCFTNEECENNAAIMVGEEFCNEFRIVNMQPVFEMMEDFCEKSSRITSTKISQGNIKARLRMITLYDIASKRGGIVIDSDNLTESNLGFYTIHGDCCDYNIIGQLWKHEVYELAQWLLENKFKDSKALKASIELIPTDGNGVKSGGDLAQIAPGATYNDVDEILQSWCGNNEYVNVVDMMNKHGEETYHKVIKRHLNSEFKRKHMPFIIDLKNGNILEKNGNIYIDFNEKSN